MTVLHRDFIQNCKGDIYFMNVHHFMESCLIISIIMIIIIIVVVIVIVIAIAIVIVMVVFFVVAVVECCRCRCGCCCRFPRCFAAEVPVLHHNFWSKAEHFGRSELCALAMSALYHHWEVSSSNAHTPTHSIGDLFAIWFSPMVFLLGSVGFKAARLCIAWQRNCCCREHWKFGLLCVMAGIMCRKFGSLAT